VNKNIQLSINTLIRLAALAIFSATILILQIVLTPKAHATSYSLNPTPAPGECTLNDVIAAINTQAVSGGCSAGTSSNTINFAAGTHTLSAPPAITFDGDLTINGAGAATTILDGDSQEGFLFNPSTGGYTISISNLTLTNFSTSGFGNTVLFNFNGNINLNHVLVHDNDCTSAEGFCVIFINIDPEYQQAVNISNSAFYNNSSQGIVRAANNGAGINMNIINNTFYGNDGAVALLLNYTAETTNTLNFVNNTVSHNNFPGGNGWLRLVIDGDGDIGTTNSYVKNNIFDSNFSGDTPNNCGPNSAVNGYIFSQGGNISSDDTCNTFFTATNDKNSTDPKLATPAFINGTYILALNSDSPAIDNGLSGGLTPSSDQRGVSRPQGSEPDSGSYELEVATPGLPNTGGSVTIASFVQSTLFGNLLIK